MKFVRGVVHLLSLMFVFARVSVAQGAVILGAVEDSAGRGIPDVHVSILGQEAALVTDAAGRFRLGPLRASTYLLQLRRLGFASITTVVNVQSSDTLRIGIEMAATATLLAPMDVTANSVSAKLERVGFVRRRLDSTVPASRFLTQAEFGKRPPLTITELLRRMGGYTVRCKSGEVIYVDGVLIAPSATAPPPPPINSKNQPITVRDGFGSVLPPPPAVDMIPPSNVAAIEAYVSPAEFPLEFKAAGRGFQCLVLIWTGDR